MAILFWVSLFLMAYVYVGYPCLVWLRAAVWPKPARRGRVEPSVTVVVVAYNEAERVGARIDNLLALDYPRNKLEILIASDGSTDGTVERARGYEAAGVTVRAFHTRRGKTAVVNDVVASARGDIVVFADARQSFDRAAVRALVANFDDDHVGAVTGELILASNASGPCIGHGVGCYWRYEKFIRLMESRGNSTVGATGAIYAIRRALFERIPDDSLLDDVLIPLQVVRAGYRVVFEPSARAYDIASSSARQEFVRKVRTLAGNFQLLAREWWLFDPRRNAVWFETISHKALRLMTPVLQLAVLVCSVSLAQSDVYRWALEAQILCYGAAAVGHARSHARRSLVVVTLPYTICVMSWATVVGFVQFITRRQQVTWDRVSSVPTLRV